MELIKVEGKFYKKADVLNALSNIVEQKTFDDGIAYALSYLSDLYPGVEETDLWKEIM